MTDLKIVEEAPGKNSVKICSICQCSYIGWGNNAEPVNSGRCCDSCNHEIVLPARMRRMFRGRIR